MKKSLGLFLVTMLILSLCACTASTIKQEESATVSTSNVSASVSSTAEDPIKKFEMNGYTFEVDTSIPIEEREFVAIFENVAINFGQVLNYGAEKASKDFGAKCSLQGAQTWNVEETAQLTDTIIARGVDGLAIAAIDRDTMSAATVSALKKGIPTIGFNSDPGEDTGRLACVKADPVQGGYTCAKTVFDKVKETYGGGKILIICYNFSNNSPILREQGVQEALKEYDKDMFNLVYVELPGDDSAVYSGVENALAANPDTVGIICDGGSSGHTASYVLEDLGIGNNKGDKPIYLADHDVFEGSLVQIQEGWMTACISQDPVNQTYLSFKMLYDFYKTYDTSVFKDVSLDFIVVDEKAAPDWLKVIADGGIVG